MTLQPALFGPECGYCGGLCTPVVVDGQTVYRCEPCQPGLAAVRTDEDWIAFHRLRRTQHQDR